MYRYEFTPEARRQLKKLDPATRQTIIRKLEYFISTDKPLSFAGYLANHSIGEYRFRIGDYRVIFDLEENIIVIHSVGHRRDVYK